MGVYEPMRRALRVLVVLGLLAGTGAACSGSNGPDAPFEKVAEPVSSYKLRLSPRITPGRSSFLVTVVGSRGYPAGMTVFRLTVEGTKIRATAPVRIGRSTHFAGGDVRELPDGGWLITSTECDSDTDEHCDTDPTHLIRVDPDGSVHEVARLKGGPQVIGVLDADHVVLQHYDSIQAPVGDHELDLKDTVRFSTLDLATGKETKVPWTPPTFEYRVSTQISSGGLPSYPPRLQTCATQDRLLSLYTPAGASPAGAELTVVDIATGKAGTPRPVPSELRGWTTMLCRPDGLTTFVSTNDDERRAYAFPVDADGRFGPSAEAPIAFQVHEVTGETGSLLITSQDMPTAADNIAALGRPDLMAALAKRMQTVSLLSLTDGRWRTLPVEVHILQRPYLSGDGRQLLVQDSYDLRGISA